MCDVIIVVSPAFRHGRRQHDHFDAYVRDTGELLCRATRQPLLDGARALLSLGYEPSDKVCMVWSHRPDVLSMSATIGLAAQYDVMGERFVRRKAPATKPVRERGPSGATKP